MVRKSSEGCLHDRLPFQGIDNQEVGLVCGGCGSGAGEPDGGKLCGWLECDELDLELKLNNPFRFGFLYSRLRWTRVDLQGKRRMACSTIGAMVTLIILSAMSTFR